MNPALIIAINAFSLINRLRSDGSWDAVKAEYAALREQLTATLPPPPNGVTWTDADLQALVEQHNALTQQIRDRHAPDGTGQP